jgi:hypothetical protein
MSPGLPDDGAPGQWLGRDALGAVYVLRWLPDKLCWGALGFRGDSPRPWPELVLLREGQAGHILGHVEGPAIARAEPPQRLSRFIGEALADVAAQDRPPTPVDHGDIVTDDAPLWPGLIWPVLPALGAVAIIAVFALFRMGWLS